jgi:DNA repair protein RadC
MKTNVYWMAKLHGAEFKVLRLQDAPTDNSTTDTPEAIVRYLREQLPNSPAFNPDVESFIVVFLNTRRRPIGWQIISTGTLDTLLVHPREVFKPAIVMNASAIILAHNHPSGDPTPSEADIKVTRDLIRAGQLMKIDVLDHVILGRATPEQPKEYASLRELGYFFS